MISSFFLGTVQVYMISSLFSEGSKSTVCNVISQKGPLISAPGEDKPKHTLELLKTQRRNWPTKPLHLRGAEARPECPKECPKKCPKKCPKMCPKKRHFIRGLDLDRFGKREEII